jgi:Zn-dependent peptidase ImmA (M78 family)
MFESSKEEPHSFVGKFNINSDYTEVARDILKTLKVDPSNYTTDYPIKEWIDAAEANGIFISRTSFIHSRLKLDSEEIQGFAIADRYAPFVFINSDDWDAPQLFSLVHELAHIWIAESGVSNDTEPNLSKQRDKLHPVELFCNEVAANALMPSYLMQKVDSSIFQYSDSVYRTAKQLGVSSFAFLVRSYNLRLLSWDRYSLLLEEADKEFYFFTKKEEEKKLLQKHQKGGPNPYLLRLNKNSRLFTQIVLDAFRGGIIEPTQASSLLNTQVNNFPKLEAFLYK